MEAADLLARGIHTLRYVWVDNSNVIRAKAVNLEVASGSLDRAVHVSQSQLAQPAVADEVVLEAGLLRTRDLVMRPDWGTVRELPWHPGHAAVMCDFGDDDAGDHAVAARDAAATGDAAAQGVSAFCPRGFLQRMAARATAAGFDVLVGVEVEFALLRRGDAGLEPGDTASFAMDSAYDLHEGLIDRMVRALGEQGVPVAQFHPESGFGHWELSLAPLPPLVAADAIVAVRQTVRALAVEAGYEVSFLPVLSPTESGCGLHLHVSLTGDAADGLGEHGGAFIAGVLDHLEPLLAVTAPSPLSMVRFRPHFSVGAFLGWGVGNKEAPLRVIASASGAWRDVEFKAADATANPYTALGALLAVGLDGVQRGAALPPEIEGDPACLTAAERDALGIRAMPHDSHAVLAMFGKSEVLTEAMGEPLHRVYAMVRADELRRLGELSFDEQVELLVARF